MPLRLPFTLILSLNAELKATWCSGSSRLVRNSAVRRFECCLLSGALKVFRGFRVEDMGLKV